MDFLRRPGRCYIVVTSIRCTSQTTFLSLARSSINHITNTPPTMAYPPPPGIKSYQTPPAPPSNLPPRPPTSVVPSAGFKPAYNAQPGYSAPITHGYQSYPTSNYPPYQQPQAAYPQQSYYDAPQESAYGAASTPQIRNPFPLPGQPGAGGRYDANADPEMEAQIAQWQSAYASKDSTETSKPGFTTRSRFGAGGEGTGSATSANAAPLGRPDGPSMSSHAVASAADGDTGVATVVRDADGKQKTVVRSGGGTQWQDSSLLEWDPAHFRIFVGNLAGEVTDESLLKAFSKWPSVQKARVVRDKRTTKSKGFGFVSFSDGDEFFQAARDMNGKYIGSHPVKITRSTTEIKAVTPKDRRGKNQKGKGKGGKGGGEAGGNAKTGAGVQKPGSMTKGGLRVLG